MVCLVLSTHISYVNVKLHEFKFQEELFLDTSTPAVGSLDAGDIRWNPHRHDAVRILFVWVKPSGLSHPATFLNLFSKYFVLILAATCILWRFSSFSSALPGGRAVSLLGRDYFISHSFQTVFGEFTKFRKTTGSFVFVRPRVSTLLPLAEFLRNLYWNVSRK